jgi:hypothetical protein
MDKITNLDFLQLTFPSVKRLDIEITIRNSLQLSQFTNLEYLDVLFNEIPTDANSAVKVIHLPLLRDLTIHIYGSTRVEWHIPILQRLTVIGWFDDGLKEPPNIRALHVRWRLGQPNYTMEIESSLLHTLQAMMSAYEGMKKFSIKASLRPIWDKYVQGLSGEERLALPRVVFDIRAEL